VVHSHGGDIIKFAGDALICIFADGQLSTSANCCNETISPNVILRAVLCAEEIRGVRTDRLTVHVGMSCGEMCFGILGGVDNRWECLISGPCIHELSQCLDDAPSMHAVMTACCAELLLFRRESGDTMDTTTSAFSCVTARLPTINGNCDVVLESTSSGNFRILDVTPVEQSSFPFRSPQTLSDPDEAGALDELIRQFVPAPIVEELDSATGLSYFAEIREVVTMFMKVMNSRAYFASYYSEQITHCPRFSGTPTTRMSSTATCWSCSRASTRPSASCMPRARTCVSSWWTTRAAC
jgi:hypothetical protein